MRKWLAAFIPHLDISSIGSNGYPQWTNLASSHRRCHDEPLKAGHACLRARYEKFFQFETATLLVKKRLLIPRRVSRKVLVEEGSMQPIKEKESTHGNDKERARG